jgi:hypothetical protein
MAAPSPPPPPPPPPPRSSPPPYSTAGNGASHTPAADSSVLQPRVAVVLGVPKRWHPFLFIARLFSIFPALWWGIRCALRFLITELILDNASATPAGATAAPHHGDAVAARAERSLRLTETVLAMVWCWASAHLAFFFTDCLMSRWLINYTPQATIIRLTTISCVVAYATSWVIYLTGASRDPGLLLPAWIGIATTLTACYQITQRKINIRKETRLSISVFSYASFISMIAMLVHSHSIRVDYPDIPLVALIKRAGSIAGDLAVRLLGVREMYDL